MSKPIKKFADAEIKALREESNHSAKKWGEDFDEQNTLNDWTAYAQVYVGRAVDMGNINNRSTQYKALIKAANILLTAATRVRRRALRARHYDPQTDTVQV